MLDPASFQTTTVKRLGVVGGKAGKREFGITHIYIQHVFVRSLTSV